MEEDINVSEINGQELLKRQQELKGLSDMCDISLKEVEELDEINKMVNAIIADYNDKINTTAVIYHHPGRFFCKEDRRFQKLSSGNGVVAPTESNKPAIFIDHYFLQGSNTSE